MEWRRRLMMVGAKKNPYQFFVSYTFTNNVQTYSPDTWGVKNTPSLSWSNNGSKIWLNDGIASSTEITTTYNDFPSNDYFDVYFDLQSSDVLVRQWEFGDSEDTTTQEFYLFRHTNLTGQCRLFRNENSSTMTLNNITTDWQTFKTACNNFKNGKLTWLQQRNGGRVDIWWNDTLVGTYSTNTSNQGGKCRVYVNYNISLKNIKFWKSDHFWTKEEVWNNI